MLVRLAKLSEGQVIDGRLECLYHGWQFEGDGQCVKIPQVISLLYLCSCMYVCMNMNTKHLVPMSELQTPNSVPNNQLVSTLVIV